MAEETLGWVDTLLIQSGRLCLDVFAVDSKYLSNIYCYDSSVPYLLPIGIL